MKKQKITELDYLKANRKASREEEIAAHSRPVPKSKVHKSKKQYDRKRTKAGLKTLPFDLKCNLARYFNLTSFGVSHIAEAITSAFFSSPKEVQFPISPS